MLKLQEVLDFIKNANQLEMAQITRVVSIRKSEVNYDVKASFRVGDTVGIDHKKIGSNETFRVIKINAKNIKVQGERGSYTVAPSLLIKK